MCATDIEPSPARGSLDDQLLNVLVECTRQDIPIVRAMRRRELGRTIKKGPTAALVIVNYDSVEVCQWRAAIAQYSNPFRNFIIP